MEGEGALEDEVGGGEGVGIAKGAEGDVLGGPATDAGDVEEGGAEGVGVLGVIEGELAGEEAAGDFADGVFAGGSGFDGGEIGGGEDLRGGEEADGFAGERVGDGPTMGEQELGGEGDGERDGDKLAKDGGDGHFEGVPGAGEAEPGLGVPEGGEKGMGGERVGDEEGIGIEVEHFADAAEELEEEEGVGGGDAELEVGRGGVVGERDFEEAEGVVEVEEAGVGGVGDGFDAREGVAAVEGEEVGKLEGGAVREREGESVVGGGALAGGAGEVAGLGGGAVEAGAEGVVETAEGMEVGGERDLGDGELGFGEELAGEVEALGLGELAGGLAEFVDEEAAEVARGDAEARGEVGVGEIGVAGEDGKGALEEGFIERRDGGGGEGCGFGAAAEAGAVAGFFGSGGAGEELDIFAQRFGGADGAAVDAGRFDADEEFAVETVIAGEQGLVEGIVVEHGGILDKRAGRGWLESDMIVGMFTGGSSTLSLGPMGRRRILRRNGRAVV